MAKIKAKAKEEFPALAKIQQLYHKYRFGVWAVVFILVLVSIYYRGFAHTLLNLMEMLLVYVAMGNILILIRWIARAKNGEQREKRIAILCGIVIIFVAVGLAVQFWFRGTDWGQGLQRLIYHHNDEIIKTVNPLDIFKNIPTPTP